MDCMRPEWPHAAAATVSSVADETSAATCGPQLSELRPPPLHEEDGLGRVVRRRIGLVLVLVSLLPIALLAFGAWTHFRSLHLEQALQRQRSATSTHALAVDYYLAERLRALRLGSRANGFEQLSKSAALRALFDSFQESYPNAFVDLGVIDSKGRHVVYVGPYHLADKNYRQAAWFQTVMSRGTYISDVFLGFRNVPHCVIAVKRVEAGRSWILRATINNDSLHALVRAGAPDSQSDAYLVNRAGVLQTPSRSQKVLERAALATGSSDSGPHQEQPLVESAQLIRATAELNGGRWWLVVEQPEASVVRSVNEAALSAAGLLAIALGLVAIASLVATRHLNAQVDRSNAQRDRLRDGLMRSARLASLGEMASGLAHEINNPLAVLSAERTNLADVLSASGLAPELVEDVRRSLERCQRQITRCGDITAKMLQFSRASEPRVRPMPVGPVFHEVRDLFSRRARDARVKLRLEIASGLPSILADPSELEQVLVNLMNNALYAVQPGGLVVMGAARAGDEVLLWVEDDGCGISPRNLDRIFQPFFTTKPPRSGTGLGLSVCHGLVGGWGGRIEVESRLGKGTTLRVFARSAGEKTSTLAPPHRQSDEPAPGVPDDEQRRRPNQTAAGG